MNGAVVTGSSSVDACVGPARNVAPVGREIDRLVTARGGEQGDGQNGEPHGLWDCHEAGT
jgi:hypothetical protein